MLKEVHGRTESGQDYIEYQALTGWNFVAQESGGMWFIFKVPRDGTPGYVSTLDQSSDKEQAVRKALTLAQNHHRDFGYGIGVKVIS